MPDKRILILNNRIPYPLTDGGNIAVHAMVEGYREQGWEVYLLAMNTTRHYMEAEDLAKIYTDIYRFDTVAVNNDVKPAAVIGNFLFSSKPNHAERFFHRSFLNRLREVIASFRPDVIQVESVFLTTYMPYIKAIRNAVTVLRLHNIEYEVWGRLAEGTKGPKRFYLKNLSARIRRYEEDAWKQYDLLLPITDDDASVVRQLLPEKDILTLPVGIDTGRLAKSQEQKEWKGYHIGAMDWLPNAEGIKWFLEEVWPAIRSEFPGFEFHFAGRKMPEYFKATNWPGAYCAGEVPDAGAFIADKSILFVPIRSGGGLRVKILEAMAQGKLVISTDVGMQGIKAVPGTHYLSANTPGAFLKAMRFVMSHSDEARTIASRGLELVKKDYDKHVIAKSLNARLKALL